jgi:hypothetical protein
MNEHHGLMWAILGSIRKSGACIASTLCTLTPKQDFAYPKNCTMVYLFVRYM